jgi:predicted RNase H-like HicB family nuclease
MILGPRRSKAVRSVGVVSGTVYDTFMAAYRVVLYHSEEGYSVSCPGLPGCWSEGETEEEALANIRLAISEYIEAAEELARDGESRLVEVGVG